MNTDPALPATPPPPAAGSAYYGHPAYGAPPTGWAWLAPRRLLRKWRTIAATMGIAVLLALAYLWSAQKIYQASSLVELSVRRPRIMTQQAAVIEDTGGAAQAMEIFNTRLEKFKGRTMLLAALARLDAACPGQFYPPSQVVPGFSAEELAATNAATVAAVKEHVGRQRDIRLKKFEKALTLTLIRRSSLIRVEFEHPDPVVAATACNEFAAAAEASAYEENRSSSDAAVVWLETQAELQRAELMKAEDALLAYRQLHKIDAMESQRKTVEDALLEFNRALVIAESAEGNARALLAKMDVLKLDPELAGELPSDIPRADEIRAALEKWRGAPWPGTACWPPSRPSIPRCRRRTTWSRCTAAKPCKPWNAPRRRPRPTSGCWWIRRTPCARRKKNRTAWPRAWKSRSWNAGRAWPPSNGRATPPTSRIAASSRASRTPAWPPMKTPPRSRSSKKPPNRPSPSGRRLSAPLRWPCSWACCWASAPWSSSISSKIASRGRKTWKAAACLFSRWCPT